MFYISVRKCLCFILLYKFLFFLGQIFWLKRKFVSYELNMNPNFVGWCTLLIPTLGKLRSGNKCLSVTWSYRVRSHLNSEYQWINEWTISQLHAHIITLNMDSTYLNMNQVLIESIGSLLQLTIVKIPVRMKGNRHAVAPLRSLKDTCVFPRGTSVLHTRGCNSFGFPSCLFPLQSHVASRRG